MPKLSGTIDFCYPVYRRCWSEKFAVKFWSGEFKPYRNSFGDDKGSGRPKTATTADNIANVYQMVLNDHRIKVEEIAEAMNMFKETRIHARNNNTVKTVECEGRVNSKRAKT